jgi:hypothetical protein
MAGTMRLSTVKAHLFRENRMNRCLPALVLGIASCFAAQAEPVTYRFSLIDECTQCGSQFPPLSGFFTLAGPVASTGDQTFSADDHSLLALSFSVPIWGPNDVYDLDGAHSSWPDAPLSKPLVPSWVRFSNGSFSAVQYEIKVSGTVGEPHMMDQFLSAGGREVTVQNFGAFSIENVTPVPEPASLSLLLAGLLPLVAVQRRRKAG